MEAVSNSEVSVIFTRTTQLSIPEDSQLRTSASSPWWWRQYAPLKRRSTPTRLNGGTFQKALIFRFILAVSTWDLTTLKCIFSPPRLEHFTAPLALFVPGAEDYFSGNKGCLNVKLITYLDLTPRLILSMPWTKCTYVINRHGPLLFRIVFISYSIRYVEIPCHLLAVKVTIPKFSVQIWNYSENTETKDRFFFFFFLN
jgi:hypothetical protein